MAALEQELSELRDALAQSQAVAAAAIASCDKKNADLEARQNEMKGLLRSHKDADDGVVSAELNIAAESGARLKAEAMLAACINFAGKAQEDAETRIKLWIAAEGAQSLAQAKLTARLNKIKTGC
jgi:hypothetical protein